MSFCNPARRVLASISVDFDCTVAHCNARIWVESPLLPVNLEAKLCAGQEELCTAFHDARDPEHFVHAPVRQFYQQALELFFEAPAILLKFWHSLACGHDNAGEVPSSPTHDANSSDSSAAPFHHCSVPTLLHV